MQTALAFALTFICSDLKSASGTRKQGNAKLKQSSTHDPCSEFGPTKSSAAKRAGPPATMTMSLRKRGRKESATEAAAGAGTGETVQGAAALTTKRENVTWEGVMAINGDGDLIPVVRRRLYKLNVEDDPVLFFAWRSDVFVNEILNYPANGVPPLPSFLQNLPQANGSAVRRAILSYLCEGVGVAWIGVIGDSAIFCTGQEEALIMAEIGSLMHYPFFQHLDTVANATPIAAILKTRTVNAVDNVSPQRKIPAQANLWGWD